MTREEIDVPDDQDAIELHVTRSDASADIVVHGEVDIHSCGQVERALTDLADDGVATVTLDLANVSFIDSSGLRALVVGHKALQDRGGRLVVAIPSASTARLLEVTGLDGLFNVSD
jgi:anti-sigma B factor antagonist